MRAWLPLLSLVLSACFSPELGPAPFACKSSPRCPEGYRCVEGICRRDQPARDLSVEAPAPGERGLHDVASVERSGADLRTTDLRPADLRRDGPRPPDSAPVPTPGFVIIKAGTFSMGSPASEPCRDTDETQHQVTLTHAYEMMIHEVTQAKYEALMGPHQNDNAACTKKDCPVEFVTWHHAAAYANAFSQQAGVPACYSCSAGLCAEVAAYAGAAIYSCPGYRLPTDAEWEHAYRAGSGTAFYNGPITIGDCWGNDPNASAIAWYHRTTPSGTSTQPVGTKAPNAWGLFDMAGNVYEWTNDWYGGDLGSAATTNPAGVTQSQAKIDPAHTEYGPQRVARGGAFFSDLGELRGAARTGFGAKTALYSEVGFRLARTR